MLRQYRKNRVLPVTHVSCSASYFQVLNTVYKFPSINSRSGKNMFLRELWLPQRGFWYSAQSLYPYAHSAKQKCMVTNSLSSWMFLYCFFTAQNAIFSPSSHFALSYFYFDIYYKQEHISFLFPLFSCFPGFAF